MRYGSFTSGIGVSEYPQNYWHSIVGCDIHSKPGSITGSLAMTNADAGTAVVDALCLARVVLPVGDSFFGSSTSGKIWKVTTAGVVSLVHTNTNGSILGMGFFNGYLYYASSTKLGRIAEGVASSQSTWSSQTDSWATFTIGNTSYHPMVEQNLTLFIGDGKYVASVDAAGSFSGNALDLQTQHVITALTPYENDLVIGTIVGAYNNRSGLFRWDTYSNSWTTEDYVDEVGINCFINADETIFISIGTVGNIYYYTGANAKKWRMLKDGRTAVTTGVNAYGSGNLNGLPLLATVRGIYSLGRSDDTFPTAQVIEYVPSLGQGTTLGALATVGSQVFVSYKNGSNYGIDKLSTDKYSGFIETPIFIGKEVESVVARYDSLPASTAIAMSTSVDGGSYTSQTVEKDDEDNREYRIQDMPLNKSTLQVRVTLTASGTTSPTLREIEITN
jgi:hypothetical protein